MQTWLNAFTLWNPHDKLLDQLIRFLNDEPAIGGQIPEGLDSGRRR